MSDINDQDLGKKLEQEYAKVKQEIKKPNILIAGATGVGKSSIINMVFGDNVAVVGTGKPVTQKIDVYESEDVDVRIFDSKGYEVAADKEFFDSVVNLAATTKTPENAIHLIWYCIAAGGGRVTDYDMNALKSFSSSDIPVAVVLTKVDLAAEEEIAAMKSVLPASLKESVFLTTTELPEYSQLNKLIAWSISKLPESLRFAFIKSQVVDLDAKVKTANLYIIEHCALAFGIGFTPIPVSDAPLLIANEMSLLGRLLYLYDLGSVTSMLGNAGLSSIVGNLLAQGGKAAVGALIKVLPGGKLVGGLISGTVGSTITAALGEAASLTSYKICQARLSGNSAAAEAMIRDFGPTILEYAKSWIKSGKTVKDIPKE